ncbi:MAG: hypothetical protein IJ594_05900 [Oscillospiraceae bacterium]|nr:hypothetical protein [Oscillospiraceae bacterium]
MERKVVILGKNYSTVLGVLRDLGHAGHPVDVIYIAWRRGDSTVIRCSRYAESCLEQVGREEEKLLALLRERYADCTPKPVLLPTDDHTALLADRFRTELEPLFVLPGVVGGEPGAVRRLMDKSVQSELAAAAGLRAAKTWRIRLAENGYELPRDLVYPCFCKPALSAEGGKTGMGKCEDEQTLLRLLDELRGRMPGQYALVQPFLQITREYTIDGVCCDGEVLLPAVIEKSRVARHNRGVTLSGTLVAPETLGETLPRILAFLRALRYVGMFDLELLQTDEGLYFGELNLRSGGPGYAYCACGVPLAAAAVRALTGEGLPAEAAPVLGRRFLNDKAAWDDYAFLHITRRELAALYRESELTLLEDPSDPRPGAAFRLLMAPRYTLMRQLRRIRRRGL